MGSSDGDAIDRPDQVSPDAQAFLEFLAIRARTDAARAKIASLPATPVPQDADLARIRDTLGLPEGNTIAAAGTDIPGLEDKPLVGLSPKLRREAGLPSLDEEYGADRDIQSPNSAPIASRHAEEDILNAVSKGIEDAALGDEELEGRVVNMHISNATGICVTCIGGLGSSKGMDGVIKLFSLKYPTVIVRITAEGGNAYKDRAVVLVRGGEFVDA